MATGTPVERQIAELADDGLAVVNRIVELQQRRGDLSRMTEWAALADLLRGARAAEIGGMKWAS